MAQVLSIGLSLPDVSITVEPFFLVYLPRRIVAFPSQPTVATGDLFAPLLVETGVCKATTRLDPGDRWSMGTLANPVLGDLGGWNVATSKKKRISKPFSMLVESWGRVALFKNDEC